MIFCMKGGKDWPLYVSPFVLLVMIPLSNRPPPHPCLYGSGRRPTLNDGKADVNGIPVEDTGKCLRDNAAHSRALDGQRRMFPGRTAAKILVGHNDVPLLDLIYKFLVNILHTMFSQLVALGGV